MADQGRWFKLWVSALSDPHLDNLSVADFGRWAKLGTYCKLHGTDGVLVLIPPARALCSHLQVADFDALISCAQLLPGITVSLETFATVTFSNWLKYQGDFSTERVRRFRQMKRSKRRREVSASSSDVEHPRKEATSEPPGNGRSSAPASWLDPEVKVWLGKSKHLGPLAEDKHADLWSTLERAYDQYPWLYFEQEIAKMDAWIEANRGRKPTPRGLPRFVRNWMERAVEYGRRTHG